MRKWLQHTSLDHLQISCDHFPAPNRTHVFSTRKYSRQGNDTKVEPVPRVSQVCELVQTKSPGHNLEQCFKCVNDSKDSPGQEDRGGESVMGRTQRVLLASGGSEVTGLVPDENRAKNIFKVVEKNNKARRQGAGREGQGGAR